MGFRPHSLHAGRVRRTWPPLPLQGLIEFIASQAGVAEQQCCMEYDPNVSHSISSGTRLAQETLGHFFSARRKQLTKQGRPGSTARLASLVSAGLIIAKTIIAKTVGAEQPSAAEAATEVPAPLIRKSTSRAYCYEFCVPCDCSQVTTAAGQCSQISYAFCSGVGTPCICSEPPVNIWTADFPLGDIILD